MLGVVSPLVALGLGAGISYLATKYVIKSAKARKWLGKDMHKPKKPLVPEFGGLGFSLGFLLSAFIIQGIIVLENIPDLYQTVPYLYLTSFVIAIATILGLMSDLFKFRWRTNAIMPMLEALPLIAIIKDPTMTMIHTPFGSIQLGPIIYGLALLLGATGSSNAINMIAGYNGLEAGMTSLIVITIGAMALISGNFPIFLVSTLMLGALLGFLYWNKYPAKTFPGDVGTWSFGAGVFALAVLGKLEFWAVLLFPLYFIHLYLLLKHKKELKKHKEKFATVKRDGTLTAKTDGSLYFWLIRRYKMTEREVVRALISIQFILSIIVLLAFIAVRGS